MRALGFRLIDPACAYPSRNVRADLNFVIANLDSKIRNMSVFGISLAMTGKN